eukprot:COSAG01_NODE_12918_length_1663_cov_5.893862_1_plen_149_part_00
MTTNIGSSTAKLRSVRNSGSGRAGFTVQAFLGCLRLPAAAIGVAFLGATFLRMGRGDAFDAFRVCIDSPATPRPGAMSTPACLAATAPAGTAAASQPHCCLPLDGGATYLAILPPTAHCWGVGGVYQNIVYERGSGPSGLTGACIDND